VRKISAILSISMDGVIQAPGRSTNREVDTAAS
jgi:hypothetical protein